MIVEDVLPRDAIPSIDDPTFSRSYFGGSEDEVIVVDANPPRAYPIRILSYHEIVNDQVGDRALAVTWCPICWSAAVYDRTVDGRELTFGVSGKLADDALVMYDRETESEWKQPTGEAIAGDLAGQRLTALPSAVVTWDRFSQAYPDGVVLQPVTGRNADRSPDEHYDMAPYHDYVERDTFGRYGMRGDGRPRSWGREDLDPKMVVLGIEHGGAARAYPIDRVEAAGGVINDRVGPLDVTVVATEEGIHAFERSGLEFSLDAGTLRADGTTWDPVSGESADGRQLDRVPATRQFAFSWQATHGRDAFYARSSTS